MGAVSALASTITWTGAGVDGNWSTVANWGGASPLNNDALVFTGATRLANLNDFLASVGAVTFSSGGYNISGNPLTLNGDFVSSGNNNWAVNSTLGGSRTFTSTSGIFTLSGSITNGSYLISVAGAGDTVISGAIANGSGGLTKTGAGSLTLSNTNAYTGATRITGGTISITSDANLGSVPGVATPASLVIDGGILSTNGTFTLSSNRGIVIGPASGQGDGTFNVNSGELTYGGIITSNTVSGTGNLVKTGGGTLTLSGANAYSGNTVVSAGILKIGNSAAVPSGLSKGDLVVTGTLDLNNKSITINGLSGSGTITSSQAGAITFTAGTNNKSGTFSGVIQNGAGTLGFVKTGTGTLTLAGSNTFTGGVTVNGGALQLANAGAINSGTPNSVTFGANAAVGTKLQLNGNSVTFGSLATNAAPGSVIVENANAIAATLTINQAGNTTFAGVLQNGTGGGTLSLVKSGPGILTFSGTNTYTGDTVIAGGTLQAGSSLAVPSGSGTGNVVLNGNASAASTGILDINGFDVSINGLSGTTGAFLGKVVNNRIGTTKTISIGSGDATTTFAGLITNNTGTGGTLNLTKIGNGTLTLSNANTYAGTTGIKNGVLAIGIANALPAGNLVTLGDGTANTSGVLKLNGFAQSIAGLTNLGSGTANRVINGSATAVSLTLNTTANSSFGGILGGTGTNENNFNLLKTGAGTMTLSGVNTFTGTVTISQGILSAGNLSNALGSGASAVILGDATNIGTLSFTGSGSTFTRGLSVSAGGGQIDTTTAGQTLTLTTGNVATSGAFTVGGAGNTSISSNVTGTGSLNKIGGGNLVLSGANTYTGGTNIRNGTIVLGVNNTGLNAATTVTLGDATANTNGVFKLDGFTQTLAGLLKTGNGTGNRVVGGNLTLGTLTLGVAGSNTFAGILGGTGTNENNLALTKSGVGTLTLSGTNTYTGGTTITGGTLSISAANNLGATSGVLNIGAGTLQVTSTLASSRSLNLIDATSAVSIGSGFNYTASGVVSGGGALNLTGAGSLVLSGVSNTYSGGTRIQNGTLTLGATNALPVSTALTLGNLAVSGKLVLNGFSQTVSSLTTSGSGSANGIVNGKITSVTFTINNTADIIFGGTLGGTGTNENAFALNKTGTGMLTLNGGNTYAGDTTISAGILQIGIATTLPSGVGKGNVSIGAAGTLDLKANSISINGLTGTGVITSSVVGPKTLTVGNNDQTSSFGGVVQDGSATVSLFKTGLGILTLTGANTYSGTTTVNLGTLKIGGLTAIPFGSGKGNVSITGSLDLNGFGITVNGLTGSGGVSSGVAGAATLAAGANDQTASYGGIISNGIGTVGFTKVGTGILTLTGISTYTGATAVKNGTLALGSGNDRLPTGTVLTLGDASTNDSGAFKLDSRSQVIAGLLASGTGTGNRVVNGNATATSLTVNNAIANDFAGILGGSGLNENNFALIKSGIGTLTLSGNNTFTGGVTINPGGILQVGNAGALNSAVPNTITFGATATGSKLQLNGYSVTIGALSTNSTPGTPVVENASATAAALTVSQASNTTYAGVIQDGTGGGALALAKTGTGTLTLATGINTYTGGTSITQGALSVAADTSLGAIPSSPAANNIVLNGGALAVTANMTLNANRGLGLGPASGSGPGTLSVASGATLTYAGIMANNAAGSGTLVKSNTGVLTIASTVSTYTGGTTISGGLLNLNTVTGTPLGANVTGNNIDVQAGANLSISDLSNKGSNQTITVTSNSGAKGGIGFSNISLTQSQLAGLFTDSTGSDGGVLSINNGISYATALNLSTFGSGASQGLWFLGGAGTGTYSATTLIIGSGNLYRLGGGNGSLTLSASNVITGTNSLQVGFGGTNGTGTLTLNNPQNFTGTTSVLGGTLSVGADDRLGAIPSTVTAGNIVLNGGALSASSTFTLNSKRGIALGSASGSGTGTLDSASGKILTYTGIIADNGGTGSLTKTGAGTLALSGNHNTYTGATNFNGGITTFDGINDLGAGTAIGFNGGTLQYNLGNTTDITTRTVTTTSAGGALIDTGANNVTFANSAISGTGLLTKLGTGTLSLNVANTYTGATNISNGTLKTGILGAIPAASVLTLTGGATAGILDINGLDTTVTNLSGTTGAVLGKIINSAAGNKTLTVSSIANSTFSGILADNGGSGGTLALAKIGTSTLTLAGANTFTGGTTISLGTLAITTDANLGTAPLIATPGNLVITGGSTLATGAMTLNANRGLAIGPSGATAAIIAVTAATTLTYNGIIANSGTATGGLTKTNTTGVLLLGGANTYAGDTTVSGGTLKLGGTSAIPSGAGKGNVSIASASVGSLDLNGFLITINGLTGAGTVTSGVAGAAGITIGANDQTSSFTGIVSNGGGTVSLGKTGTGALTLSGASTYTGGTTITGGVLSIGADNNLGTAPGSATPANLIINGGTLSTSTTLTLNSNRGIAVGPSSGSGSGTFTPSTGTTLTYGGIIANNGGGSGGLVKSNTTGTLVLSGANTYSGDTSILGGTLKLGDVAALPSGSGKGNLALSSGGLLDLNNLSPTVNGLSGSGTVTNNLTGSVTFTAGGNDMGGSFGGVVQDGAGTVALTKTGSGTLTLSGVNTYSGITTVTGGILQLGIASALPSGVGKGNVALAGTLDLAGFSSTVNGLSGSGVVTNSSATAAVLTAGASDQTSAFSGNIQNGTGSVALTKTGNGTLTLSGINLFSGATNISAGTLAIGSTTGLSAGSTLTIASAGSLDVNGFNITIDGLLGTGTITNNGGISSILTAGAGGTSSQFDGVIADGTNAIALTKSGAGTLTLTGVNTYGGATAITNGTLSVANPGTGGNLGNATSAVTLGDSANKGILSYTANADLTFTRGFDVSAGGGQMTITSLGKTITLQTGGVTTAGTFTIGGAGNAVISSVISGSGGFTKANTGTMIVNSANTYSGDTVISTGTLQLANAAALPSGIGKGNVVVNGTLDVGNFNITVNGLSGSGTVTNSLGSPVTLTAGGNNAIGNFSGVIQDGTGTTSLVKTGTGTLALTGTNTYSGDTAINAGTIQIGNTAAIASGAYKGNLSLAAAGTLDLNNYNLTVNGLTGAGTVTNNTGASVFTVGANDQTATFTGNIQDGLGTIGLTKSGTGTLTLSGINTFTGTTTISGGTLVLGSATALSAGSTLTVENAGTLDLNGRVISIDGLAGTGSITNNSVNPITLTTGASGGSGIFGGTINDGSGVIALVKNGSGTITLTHVNSYSGGTTVNGGLLAITSFGALGAIPASPLPGNIVLNGGGISASNTFEIDSKRGIAVGPTIGTGAGILDAAQNQTLTYRGIVANNNGTGGLTKTGLGTVTLGGANTFSGDTTIAGGALQIDNVFAIPSGFGRGNVILNGTLDLNDHSIVVNGLSGSGTVSNTKTGTYSLTVGDNNQTSTFSGTIQDGNGITALAKTGSGTLTLSGTNTFTGGTTHSGGTLALASSAALGGAGPISMNGGTLQFSASNTNDYSSRITIEDGKTAIFDTNSQHVSFGSALTTGLSGSGSLVKAGAGKLTLTSSNNYSGGTTVASGTLELGNGTTNGSVAGNISDSGMVSFNNGSTQSYAGAIIGTGSFNKSGTANLSLTGSSSYTGATSVSAGTLLVNGSLGNTTTAVTSGATLGGTGTLGGDVTVNGIVAPGDLNSIGSLGMNSLDLANTMAIQWNGTTDTIDQLNITNLLQLRATSTVAFSGLGGNLTLPAYVFATYGSLSGTSNQFGNVTNLPTGYVIDYAYGATMNQLALVTIPEPRAALLGGIGLVILLRRRRDCSPSGNL